MSPDDPRHGSGAGYQQHLRDGEKVCGACSAARGRQQKQTRWEKHRGEQLIYSAQEVEAVLAPWLSMGLTPTAIAEAAGLGTQRGSRLGEVLRLRGNVRRGTYRRLAAVTEDDFSPKAKLDGDLTRRRIYSLMAAGQPLASMPINATGQWRARQRISVATARAIRDHYQANEFVMGPNHRTAARARNAGHQPPLAWDDPGTLGWVNPPPKETPAECALDEVVVERAVSGRRIDLTDDERDEVIRRMAAAGRTDQEIAPVLGVSDKTIWRWRKAHGVASRVVERGVA